jgi:hypothetical protein
MDNPRETQTSNLFPEGEGTNAETPPPRPPLQYSLRGLFLLTLATALLFGTMRWFGVSPEASALVLVVLMIAGAAAVGLLIAILRE